MAPYHTGRQSVWHRSKAKQSAASQQLHADRAACLLFPFFDRHAMSDLRETDGRKTKSTVQ